MTTDEPNECQEGKKIEAEYDDALYDESIEFLGEVFMEKYNAWKNHRAKCKICNGK